MNVSFNISAPTINPSQVEDLSQANQTAKSDKTLTVSITTGLSGTDGTNQPTAITLSYPLVDLSEIELEKVTQQLKDLDVSSLKGMKLAEAVLQLNQDIGEIADGIIEGGKAFVEANAEQLTAFFDGAEKAATKAETQLFDLINNSTYPDFTKFLSKMLEAAQELKQLASEAKHSLVLADYNNTLEQAKQMEIAAQKNYESTMKEIKASQMESIGKIISGSLSILSIGAAGAGGMMGKQGGMRLDWGTRINNGFQNASMLGAPTGNALGSIVEGSMGLAAGKERTDGAALKKEAELASALQKKLEGTGKLLQEAQGITEELREIAKTLADAMLKMHQDFIANQQQIVQRANI